MRSVFVWSSDHNRADGNKMAEATDQNKTVPDGVHVAQSRQHIERCAEGIRNAARYQQTDGKRTQDSQYLVGNDHHQPSQPDVDQRREQAKASGEKQFHDYARKRQSPDQPKQEPAPRTAQADQREGGVSAGDQQKDCTVIAYFEDGPSAWCSAGVVEGRSQVEQG